MTLPEPYVAEPSERPPAPRLYRFRPLVATLAGLVIALSIAYLVAHAMGAQDPSLQVPLQRG